jgi:hypothetical protein
MTMISPIQPGQYPQRLFRGETEDLFPQLLKFRTLASLLGLREAEICVCVGSVAARVEISSSLNGIVLGKSSLNGLNYDPSPSDFRI